MNHVARQSIPILPEPAEDRAAENRRHGSVALFAAAGRLQVAADFLREGGVSDEIGTEIGELSLRLGSLLRKVQS